MGSVSDLGTGILSLRCRATLTAYRRAGMVALAGLYRVVGYFATREITIFGSRFVIPVPYKGRSYLH
jgi:hypothetical protein